MYDIQCIVKFEFVEENKQSLNIRDQSSRANKNYVITRQVMELMSSAVSYIFHNQHNSFNNLACINNLVFNQAVFVLLTSRFHVVNARVM